MPYGRRVYSIFEALKEKKASMAWTLKSGIKHH